MLSIIAKARVKDDLTKQWLCLHVGRPAGSYKDDCLIGLHPVEWRPLENKVKYGGTCAKQGGWQWAPYLFMLLSSRPPVATWLGRLRKTDWVDLTCRNGRYEIQATCSIQTRRQWWYDGITRERRASFKCSTRQQWRQTNTRLPYRRPAIAFQQKRKLHLKMKRKAIRFFPSNYRNKIQS